MSTEDIAREIGASAATVRRDLTVLARQGRLVRVHGGAAATAATPGIGGARPPAGEA
jgi:DeoR/GlpR family transcriptional regulator of sugar metabolism